MAKFRYSRPEFLQLKTEDEILVSADHQIRPIILPRDVTRLPWKSGYAECINAGKSMRNEDQAACYQGEIIRKSTSSSLPGPSSALPTSSSNFNIKEHDQVSSNVITELNSTLENKLPWVYFGIFDGHAGTAVAVAAASQLHTIIGDKLNKVSELILALEFDFDENDKESDEFTDCTDEEEKLTSLPPVKETVNNCVSTNALSKPNTTDDNDNNMEQKVETTMLSGSPESTNGKTDQSHQVDVKSKVALNSNNYRNQSVENDHAKKMRVIRKLAIQIVTDDYQTDDVYVRRSSSNAMDSISPERGLPSMTDICRNNVTVDSLIIGALESSFWEMDTLIAQDKHVYKMPGGCTAIVSLFILGKLYVCNAGDSRAIVCKNGKVIPMSFDFTPTSERERILRLGLQRPEFLGTEFTHLEFLKRPTRRDVGKQMLYKDAYMTGWSMKTITYDDLKYPLVWGEGKRSRVLATIGVTRGFGDHELRTQYGSVLIKPFLTPEPEVRVLPLESDDSLTAEDVLIMGSDGLWDVTANQEAADIVKNSFDLFPDNEESRLKYRYMTAAQDLVIHSRGHTTNWNNVWRTNDDRIASFDDIAVFVIPLKQYKEEYLAWKKSRTQSISSNRTHLARSASCTVNEFSETVN